MEDSQEDLFDKLMNFHFEDVSECSNFATLLRDNLPVANIEDKYVSLTFVDLARDPIALTTRYAVGNFEENTRVGLNQDTKQLQYVQPEGIVRSLLDGPNLVVIDDVENIEEEDPVHSTEKEYMVNSGWKSAIFHTMFVDQIIYGYITVYSLERIIFLKEVDRITDFLADFMPLINEKLLSQAYLMQMVNYRQTIQEIRDNVSDFYLSIDREGMIIQSNDASNLYLGKSEVELKGKNLREISPEMYNCIHESLNTKHCSMELTIPSGQVRVLEITAWTSKVSSENDIICIGTDLTWMKEVKSS
ncbi:MAG: PAS domain-containing protein [Candidatus Kariarchaeaceae archaeon]|jgi:PAS domain-containing protein